VQSRQFLDRLPAVGTLGDDLEPVRGREDPRETRADDGLVVDESDPDHRLLPSPTGSWQLNRHPLGVGPAANSPPSAVARSCMPIRPYLGRSRSKEEDDGTIGPVVSATMATRPFVSSSPSDVLARGAWRAAFASASWVIR
jgi:hypothetical protein